MFAFPVLMYHEVLPGGEAGVGDALYRTSPPRFAEQVTLLSSRGWRILGLDAVLAGRRAAGRSLALTFDDGTADHHHRVLPFLLSRGLTGTFFVTTAWVDRRGYLSRSEVAEMSRQGMSIQSHTHSHRYLDDLDRDSIRDELKRSRDLIAGWTGRTPVHLSCPGGRIGETAREVAREDGWSTICTSAHGQNAGGVDPFSIERLAVRSWHSAHDVEALAAGGRGEAARRIRHHTLDLAKHVLGNRTYESVRRWALRAFAGGAR